LVLCDGDDSGGRRTSAPVLARAEQASTNLREDVAEGAGGGDEGNADPHSPLEGSRLDDCQPVQLLVHVATGAPP
jgi:hypothetical protein